MQRKFNACHGKLDDSIFCHNAFDQWRMFLAHVLVVIFFAHAGLTIGADRPLEQAPRFLAVGSHVLQERSGEQELIQVFKRELDALFESGVGSNIAKSYHFADSSRPAVLCDGISSITTPRPFRCVPYTDLLTSLPISTDTLLDAEILLE